MPNLIIELERTTLSPDRIPILREELKTGGLAEGRMAIGDITDAPEMVYYLWHDSGEVPVSMLIRRDSIEDAAGMRASARDFLLKWHKRLD